MGARIETPTYFHFHAAVASVAPFMGARIETPVMVVWPARDTGRPLHGGADRNKTVVRYVGPRWSRPLHGGADRNKKYIWDNGGPDSRPLHGGADRNIDAVKSDGEIVRVAPFTGARIETSITHL